ncbi:MAG: YgiT-type zinc finger protein [Dehalococcoidia bacterium]
MSTEFGYRCEYCDGIVRPKRVEREAFKHKNGFVILEDVLIGVCARCGSRYYSAATLRRVHEIASGQVPFERTEPVPVAHAGLSRGS